MAFNMRHTTAKATSAQARYLSCRGIESHSIATWPAAWPACLIRPSSFLRRGKRASAAGGVAGAAGSTALPSRRLPPAVFPSSWRNRDKSASRESRSAVGSPFPGRRRFPPAVGSTDPKRSAEAAGAEAAGSPAAGLE